MEEVTQIVILLVRLIGVWALVSPRRSLTSSRVWRLDLLVQNARTNTNDQDDDAEGGRDVAIIGAITISLVTASGAPSSLPPALASRGDLEVVNLDALLVFRKNNHLHVRHLLLAAGLHVGVEHILVFAKVAGFALCPAGFHLVLLFEVFSVEDEFVLLKQKLTSI